MTGRTGERLRRLGARTSGVPLVLAALMGCTGGGPGSTPGESQAAAAVPNQVPDASVAATDGPRPDVTDVVLSFAAWDNSTGVVEAAGYVSPVVEDGGTCTLELEQDGRTVVVTMPGEPDATTTVCGDLRASRDGLAAGEWTAVLHYRSATTQGSSEPVTVGVPW